MASRSDPNNWIALEVSPEQLNFTVAAVRRRISERRAEMQQKGTEQRDRDSLRKMTGYLDYLESQQSAAAMESEEGFSLGRNAPRRAVRMAKSLLYAAANGRPVRVQYLDGTYGTGEVEMLAPSNHYGFGALRVIVGGYESQVDDIRGVTYLPAREEAA